MALPRFCTPDLGHNMLIILCIASHFSKCQAILMLSYVIVVNKCFLATGLPVSQIKLTLVLCYMCEMFYVLALKYISFQDLHDPRGVIFKNVRLIFIGPMKGSGGYWYNHGMWYINLQNVVCFFSTKMMRIMKFHFGHRNGKYDF